MYEISDSADMIVQFLGEGKTLSHEPRKLLSEGIIEAFDMISLSRFLPNCTMTIRGNHCFIRLPKVSIGNGTLSIDSGQRSPELAGWFSSSIADKASHNFARLSIHCQPNINGVLLTSYKRPYFITFNSQASFSFVWNLDSLLDRVYLVIDILL